MTIYGPKPEDGRTLGEAFDGRGILPVGSPGEPALGRVVVVGSGVDGPVVSPVVVRQKRVGRVGIERAKSKLQNAHAGQMELIAQRIDLWRDHP